MAAPSVACKEKQKFHTYAEAVKKSLHIPDLTIYHCRSCGQFHRARPQLKRRGRSRRR